MTDDVVPLLTVQAPSAYVVGRLVLYLIHPFVNMIVLVVTSFWRHESYDVFQVD
jgi:hypothetical protein